jgi:hypothetical protein
MSHTSLETTRLRRKRRAYAGLASDQPSAILQRVADAQRSVAAHALDELTHRGRTPLAVITEFASLLRDGVIGELSEEQKHAADLIGDRAWDLSRWIDELANAATLALGTTFVNRSNCSVTQLLNAVVPRARRKATLHGCQLLVQTQDGLPDVYCDPTLAERVIAHLTAHALDAAGEGSDVVVRAWARSNGEAVAITFRYNGRRISPGAFAPLAQQFEPKIRSARQRQGGSSGLVLSVAGDLARINFGTIAVQRDPHGANVIRVTLPVADPAALVRAFLRFDSTSPPAAKAVVMMAVSANPQLGEVNNILKGVLRCSTRGADLVIPIGPSTWLALLRSDAASAQGFQSRVNRLFKTFRPADPDDPTCPVRCRVLGRGDARSDGKRLEDICRQWFAAAAPHSKSAMTWRS